MGFLTPAGKTSSGTAVASPLAAMSGLRTVPRWHGLLMKNTPTGGNCPPAQRLRSRLIGQGYRSRYANKNRHALDPLRWISVKSFNGQHHVLRSAAASFFFVGADVFCLHGKQSRQGPPQGRAGTFGRRCVSAPLWTSKHGFEKRSFEKPLSAPYSFLNKAHFLVLIPAVLKTIVL